MTSIETLLFGRGIRSLKPGRLIYNEVRQDREHRATRGALDPPDGEPTQPDTGIMGVAGETPAATTGRLVGELKANGEEESHDAFDKRLAIAKQLRIRSFVVKIDGDGAVFAGLVSGVAHESPSGQRVVAIDDPRWG